MNFQLSLPFTPIPDVRVMYNVGALCDVPTGSFLKGKHGEMILNGGVGACTGVVGIGNQFKSTFMEYMMGTVVARYLIEDENCYVITYDTEINKTTSRLSAIVGNLYGVTPENNPVENGRWRITDKTTLGDEWFDQYKAFVDTKFKNAKQLMRVTPFFIEKKNELFTEILPTPAAVDSISEFETSDVADMKEDNSLGEKSGNTMWMRQGLSKMRMLSELPKHIANGNTPFFMTAHVGKYIAMDPNAPQPKKLAFLKNGDVVKGVSDKFFFLTTVCWQCTNAAPLINDGTKGPEYPADQTDNMKLDTDLMLVTVTLLRNKYGRSGLMMQIIVSQELGVQPSLTEFHYLKTVDRYGFEGNLQNYNLILCPDIKLSRTTIRRKIDTHQELRRALNILAEMLQITSLMTDKDGVFCTPQELYADLIAMGYDWPTLLNTRGWWTYDNDKQPIPFLSTMDLMRMRKGLYVPYWWPKETKPIDLTKAK